MQRNFLRGLLICLIPCVVAGFYAARPEKYRLGIDLAGGTILVYQINLERTKLRKQTEQGPQTAEERARDRNAPPEGLTNDEMNQLAAQIKRRIDPTDIKNVTVRPSGDRRIEIILPTGGAAGGRSNLSTEGIEEVKRLISQMGVLEFRIMANGRTIRPASSPPGKRSKTRRRRKIKSGSTRRRAKWNRPPTWKCGRSAGCRLRRPKATLTWTSATRRPKSAMCGWNSARSTAKTWA